jgi:hypothetical protein
MRLRRQLRDRLPFRNPGSRDKTNYYRRGFCIRWLLSIGQDVPSRHREVVDLVDADTSSSLGAFAATAQGAFAGWSLGKPNLAFNPNGTLLFQGAKNGIRVGNSHSPEVRDPG